MYIPSIFGMLNWFHSGDLDGYNCHKEQVTPWEMVFWHIFWHKCTVLKTCIFKVNAHNPCLNIKAVINCWSWIPLPTTAKYQEVFVNGHSEFQSKTFVLMKGTSRYLSMCLRIFISEIQYDLLCFCIRLIIYCVLCFTIWSSTASSPTDVLIIYLYTCTCTCILSK